MVFLLPVVLRAGLLPKAILLCVLISIGIIYLPLRPFDNIQLVKSSQQARHYTDKEQIPLSGDQDGDARNVSIAQPFQSAIWNRTLGFEKIFIIGLPSRTDHRDQMTLAGSLTDMDFTFRDGVKGEDVLSRVLPPDAAEADLTPGYKGSWRAHMNVLQEIVAKNISTALIMEDDVDWDLRIRTQLEDFAQGIRTWNDTKKSDTIARSTFFKSRLANTPEGLAMMTNTRKITNSRNSTYQKAHAVPVPGQVATDGLENAYPRDTPYGSDWDLLWLGHCGVSFPTKEKQPSMPLHRVAILNDPTVPNHDKFRSEWSNDDIKHLYPERSRVVHAAAENTCSLVYAITQRAARQMLFEIGLQSLAHNYDIMLRWFCDAQARAPTDQWFEPGSLKRDNGTERTCLTVQPQLFNHHRAVGSENKYSEISIDTYDKGTFNEVAHSNNIRWSTMVNLARLLAGRKDYIDSWPDK